MDRRLLFFVAIVVALIVLSFLGMPPPVLWQKAQEFGENAIGAAQNTRRLSNQREKRMNDATAMFDDEHKKR